MPVALATTLLEEPKNSYPVDRYLVNTWVVHTPPAESTHTPTPRWVKSPSMLELCPALAANPPNIEDTDPPTATFSPTELHGGRNLPRLLWERAPLAAICCDHARASASRPESRDSAARPLAFRWELINDVKELSYPALNPPDGGAVVVTEASVVLVAGGAVVVELSSVTTTDVEVV